MTLDAGYFQLASSGEPMHVLVSRLRLRASTSDPSTFDNLLGVIQVGARIILVAELRRLLFLGPRFPLCRLF